MFSGIVETTGTVRSVQTYNNRLRVKIEPNIKFDDCEIGDSVAVNGICLTITNLQCNTLSFDVIPETTRLTNIDKLKINQEVNLERALIVGSRISGHIVQGHIDNTAKIISICKRNGEYNIKFSACKTICDSLINKGFVAIDGISLTLASVSNNTFQICFIPHTISNTTVKKYQVGDYTNVEIDITSKTIKKYLTLMEQHNV